jgi:hypothetical protein
MFYSIYSSLSSTHVWLRCSNFFNPSKKKLFWLYCKYEKPKTYQHPYVLIYVLLLLSYRDLSVSLLPQNSSKSSKETGEGTVERGMRLRLLQLNLAPKTRFLFQGTYFRSLFPFLRKTWRPTDSTACHYHATHFLPLNSDHACCVGKLDRTDAIFIIHLNISIFRISTIIVPTDLPDHTTRCHNHIRNNNDSARVTTRLVLFSNFFFF